MSRPPSICYAEVIGDPIAQSKSPAIHNHWLAGLGLDAEYRTCHVRPQELADYLRSRRDDADWRGCNVTMPHKQAVMAFLDRIDSVAEQIGAVNTIVRDADGTLTGTNTDAAGFLEPLREELARPHLFRMARIFGTGGAARAIIVALKGQGVTMVLAGRDVAKARRLLDELDPDGDHHAADMAHFADPTDFAFDDREGIFDLVVNASPLGMTGHSPLPLDFSHVPPCSTVYDIVTSPPDTPLLRSARDAGFATLDGFNMLIGQAAPAFERFFGQPPPRGDGDRALRALLTG